VDLLHADFAIEDGHQCLKSFLRIDWSGPFKHANKCFIPMIRHEILGGLIHLLQKNLVKVYAKRHVSLEVLKELNY